MPSFYSIPTYPGPQPDPLISFFAALSPAEEKGAAGTSKQKQQSSQSQLAKNAAAQTQCRSSNCQPYPQVYKRIIHPHFDVFESEDSFVFEGELPGVSDKSAISITFEGLQTIVIRGEVKPTHAQTEPQEQSVPSAVTAEGQLQQESSAPLTSEPERKAEPNERHSVTVEEVVDESDAHSNDDFEIVEGENAKADKGKQLAAKPASADVEMTEAIPTVPAPQEKTAPKRSTPKRLYWINERSVGVFERSFSVKSLVDTERVRATLDNGLLTIVVPKRRSFVRKIRVE